MDFQIKAKDIYPSLEAQIVLGGVPVDLTGLTVSFRYKPVDPRHPQAARDKACTIVNAPQGRVRVDWTTGDTYPATEYHGEFTILNGAATLTYPADGYISMRVTPRLPAP